MVAVRLHIDEAASSSGMSQSAHQRSGASQFRNWIFNGLSTKDMGFRDWEGGAGWGGVGRGGYDV